MVVGQIVGNAWSMLTADSCMSGAAGLELHGMPDFSDTEPRGAGWMTYRLWREKHRAPSGLADLPEWLGLWQLAARLRPKMIPALSPAIADGRRGCARRLVHNEFHMPGLAYDQSHFRAGHW